MRRADEHAERGPRDGAGPRAVGDKVQATYWRGNLFEKRRQLAEAWAAYCTGEPRGAVIPLRAAQ